MSIIVPAHDAAEHLPETLASVNAQTFSDWEVIAVDDGSADATSEILAAAGPKVRALRNDTATGPAAARNRALAAASGSLAVFLDADDLLEPGYLERQIACLEHAERAGRKVGLVCCDARLLDPGGLADHTYLEVVGDGDRPLTLARVLRRNPIYISALVPVSAGAEVGWFDEELFGTEDWGLWLKLLEQGYEAVLNPEPLAVYRRRAGSVSADIASQAVNNRRAYELALTRGRLVPRERRIAKRMIRYNRAMEDVARLRFGSGRPSAGELVGAVPRLLWVAATNPAWWGQWLRILAGGRARPRRSRRAR